MSRALRGMDRGVVIATRGKKQLRVRLDGGERECTARRDHAPRRVCPGDRVRLIRSEGPPIAVLEGVANAPAKPLPEILARAVAASLAAGESAFVIAERFGIAVEQVVARP
jgi:hypothetical protein